MSSDVAATGAAPLGPVRVTARISRALDSTLEVLSSGLFIATVVLALVQVFFRYVLNDSLSWPDELNIFQPM